MGTLLGYNSVLGLYNGFGISVAGIIPYREERQWSNGGFEYFLIVGG